VCVCIYIYNLSSVFIYLPSSAIGNIFMVILYCSINNVGFFLEFLQYFLFMSYCTDSSTACFYSSGYKKFGHNFLLLPTSVNVVRLPVALISFPSLLIISSSDSSSRS
jgi:hypothetical protein